MVIGFVTIQTKPAEEHKVYRALLKTDGLTDVQPLFGEYDIIAKVENKDFNEIGQLVIDEIRTISCVIETNTLTVAPSKDMPSYYRN